MHVNWNASLYTIWTEVALTAVGIGQKVDGMWLILKRFTVEVFFFTLKKAHSDAKCCFYHQLMRRQKDLLVLE